MGLLTLFSSWYQRSVDERQDPESLVIQGDVDTLKRRLNSGLSPNFNDLLWYAITCENIQIAALLIFHGADPNKSYILNRQQSTVGGTILSPQYYCESVVKFMQTYNAHFEHLGNLLAVNTYVAAAFEYAPKHHKLYELIQAGEYAFDKKDYVKAKSTFEKSIPVFEEFIQEEEEKLKQQLAGVSVAVGPAKHAKETHPDIIHYYKVRRDNYLTKMAECTFQLSGHRDVAHEVSDDDEEAASLLGRESKKSR